MGNLKSNKTKEEWDDLVDKTQSHSDQVIDIMNTEQFIQEAAEKFADDCTLISDVRAQVDALTNKIYYVGFIKGAEWMMENIKINLRRVR